MKSTLLQEAIEDAKLLKETATKTAMDTLKESFAPTVNKMIMERLLDENDDIDLEESEDLELDENDDIDLEESEDLELDEILRELEDEDTIDEEDNNDLNITLSYNDDDVDVDLEPDIDSDDEPIEENDEEWLDLGEDDLDSTIDEILNEFDDIDEDESYDDEDSNTIAENKKLRRNNRILAKRNKSLALELNETKNVISKQKKVINEVALLNTKLLYMTKISNKFNLTTESKTSILQSLDRCATIREAKLTYATIIENFNTLPSSSMASKIKKSASDSINVIKESKDNKIDFNFVNRWQKLAGIK